MEGFSSINWDKAVDESNSFFLKDEFQKSSAAYHKVHAIPQSPWPSKAQQNGSNSDNKWNPCNLKREVVEGVGGNGKVLKIQLPVPYPQKSVLSVTEQTDYLFAILRVMKGFTLGTPSDQVEVKRIRDLQNKLKEEIQEFQSFAQQTIQKNPSVYTSLLNNWTAKYVNLAWQTQLSSVQQYPQFYNLIGSIALIPKENIKTIDMILQQTVLELGRIPCQMFPPLNTLIKLQKNAKIVNHRYPADVLENEQVSKDSNAVKLAAKYGAEIVVSSNTLRSLAGNVGPLFKHFWDIPFIVKDVTFQGETKKVIVVDEPLPPIEMTAMEKNAYFNHLCVKLQFTNTNRSRFFTYPGSGIFSKKKEEHETNTTEDIFDSYNADVDSVETFGIEKDTPLPPKPRNTIEPKLNKKQQNDSNVGKLPKAANQRKTTDDASSTATDSDDASLIIDTGNDESPRKKRATASRKSQRIKVSTEKSKDSGSEPSQSPKKKIKITEDNVNKKPEAPVPNLLNVILQDQEKLMQSNRKLPDSKNKQQEDPQDYVPPKINQNLTYRTWDLQANDKFLRLLVRSSVDTALVTSSGEFRTFLMVPKMEYQPWYGAECVSPREMYEQWIDLRLRPECKLFRVRMDAYTGDFIMAEQKDCACFEAEIQFQYGDQFKPINCLRNIWAVLSGLRDMNLDSGSYLLRHGFHDGICIQVWQSTESTPTSLDLHQIYSEVDPNANAVRDVADNWLALDPLAILPIQRALNRPPLTFEPEKEDFRPVNVRKKVEGKKKKPQKGGKGPTKKP